MDTIINYQLCKLSDTLKNDIHCLNYLENKHVFFLDSSYYITKNRIWHFFNSDKIIDKYINHDIEF
jgi:hypothetical protein